MALKKKVAKPVKRAKVKAPKVKSEPVNPNKTVSGDSSFIVRYLAPRHEQALAEFRKVPGRSKTTSGSINEILDRFPGQERRVAELEKELIEWQEATRAHIRDVEAARSVMDREAASLSDLISLCKRRSPTGARQTSLLDHC